MKTKTVKNTEYYYDTKCLCGGWIDSNTGICKKCGQAGERREYETETGIIWYEVATRHGTARFSCEAGEDEEYNRKLVSALRRCGCRLNGVWMDGCAQPDSCDGNYGYYIPQNRGGGFSVNGRFSIEKI
jgi:hypothetical protein